MVKYFWDTYALVLLLNGDERILHYTEEEGITSSLNVAELCAYLLREGYECALTEEIDRAFTIIERIPTEAAIEAAEIRHVARQKGKKWSYVDAIGYVLAQKIGARFLTGDREFNGEKNVEYVGKG